MDDVTKRARGPGHELRSLATEMHQLIQDKCFDDALAIADAMILVVDAPLHFYCNALWLTMEGNTAMPLQPKRAHRFLTAALVWGEANPEIYLNAAFVFLELGDHEGAVQHLLLAKQHEVDLEPHLDEPVCASIRSHERWAELEGELAETVDALSWTELVTGALLRDDFDSAAPVLLSQWRKSRHPRIADALDRIAGATGERAGYRAWEIERCLREASVELAESIRLGARWRVSEEDNEWLSYQLDDPRSSTALVRTLLGRRKFPAEKRVEHGWLELLKHIAAARDARMVEPLRRYAEQLARWFAESMASQIAEAMLAAADRIERHASHEELDGDALTCLALLEERLPELPSVFEFELDPDPDPPKSPPGKQSGDQHPLLSIWRRTRSVRVATLLECRRSLGSAQFRARSVTSSISG